MLCNCPKPNTIRLDSGYICLDCSEKISIFSATSNARAVKSALKHIAWWKNSKTSAYRGIIALSDLVLIALLALALAGRFYLVLALALIWPVWATRGVAKNALLLTASKILDNRRPYAASIRRMATSRLPYSLKLDLLFALAALLICGGAYVPWRVLGSSSDSGLYTIWAVLCLLCFLIMGIVIASLYQIAYLEVVLNSQRPAKALDKSFNWFERHPRLFSPTITLRLAASLLLYRSLKKHSKIA